jgi:hypothetical protein
VCSPSTVSIFLGNGDGTFQPHVDYAVGTATDLNGDGKLDLAVTNAFDGTVSILLGNGDGTFQPQVIYATAGSSAWQSIVVGDFNGDGKLDLAVSCGSVVSVLLGNGDGTFKAHLDSGVGGISLAAGDFNGDGKLDLVETGGGLLSVLLGNGDGTFILKEQYAGGSAVAASDLRRNGILDLIVSGTASVNGNIAVAILLGNGDGTFQAATNYGTGSSPFGFTLADLNGDGKLDLALADSGCAIVGNPCTGILTISDNVPGSPQAVPLSGIGAAAPDFSITPASGSPTSLTINAGQNATIQLGRHTFGSVHRHGQPKLRYHSESESGAQLRPFEFVSADQRQWNAVGDSKRGNDRTRDFKWAALPRFAAGTSAACLRFDVTGLSVAEGVGSQAFTGPVCPFYTAGFKFVDVMWEWFLSTHLTRDL